MDRSLEPALITALLWLLFGGSHILLAHVPVRRPLIERFGRWGFLLLYYAVAAPTFTALVVYFAKHRYAGAPGLALGSTAAAPWLEAVSFVGMALVVVALVEFPRSAYAGEHADAREPRGIEPITRHAFFVGLALLGGAHALLASRLVSAVFMGGLAVFVLAGAVFQDRKLLVLRGAPHAEYLRRTSTLPFAAVLAGRTRLGLRALPWPSLALGVAAAWGLRAVHDGILARGGLWVALSVVGGAAFFALRQYSRERRAARPDVSALAS